MIAYHQMVLGTERKRGGGYYEIFQRREATTVASLVRQISRLQLVYLLVIVNGLPQKYEHFIVQDSFDPVASSTE